MTFEQQVSVLAEQASQRPAGWWIRTLAVWTSALAIAAIPVFSWTPGLSVIPQLLSVVAAAIAAFTLLYRVPRFHLSMLAYVALIGFWGLTLVVDSDIWDGYQTFLKIAMLALTAHIVFREPRDLLVLFSAVCLTGVITLALNWGELRNLSSSISGAANLTEEDRFAGTFSNANTAGMYGVMTITSGLVVFFNVASRVRWALLGIALTTGLTVCYFSGSRKAMLGLGLVAVVGPWIGALHRPDGRFKWVKGLICCLGGLALGGIAISQLPYLDRLMITFTEGVNAEYSSQERLSMFRMAMELWMQNPIFGCGFDGFARFSGYGVYSHSTLGEVLCNGGLLALSLVAIFYMVAPVHLLAFVRPSLDPFRARLALSLLLYFGIFAVFSTFAMMLDAREYIALYGAICGYIQEQRDARLEVQSPAIC